MTEYKKFDRKAASIVTKLQNEINNGKVYENQGQKELRKFEDDLNNTDLSYPEKYQLKSMLSTRIDNLNYSTSGHHFGS